MSKVSSPMMALRSFVAQYQTQKDAALALGIARSYLNDVLSERRGFSDHLLDKLGLKRQVVRK